MKYFYDTEFLENGSTIDLISIGIVAEDGREYYAVNSDMDHGRIAADEWLCKNVVPHLPLRGRKPTKNFGSNRWSWSLDMSSTLVKPKWVIANEVREFLLAHPDTEHEVELWADYGAYDHVALAQLWGRMIRLPKGLPMFTHEFQQRWRDAGRPELPEQTDGQHDALADARHLKECFEVLQQAE
ncbi:3'-5' exoribonuclease domain-containing protein [Rhodococcus pyridinivorans]|uniref:3'-5' exoribonuclease domain-containing protein n=1 Tax=Rhodococcus pyridinivorans TaxID=103816 RepID=UPI003AAB9DD3